MFSKYLNISLSLFLPDKSTKEPPHVRTSPRQEISLSRVVSKNPRNFALSVRLCLVFLVIWPLRNDKTGTHHSFLGFLSSLWHDVCGALYLSSEMFLEIGLFYHSLCLHREMVCKWMVFRGNQTEVESLSYQKQRNDIGRLN